MNNSHTIVILTIVLAAGTGAAVASAVQASRVLDATGLHIRGTDGKLYARLESWVGQVPADENGQVADSHGAHLVFYDEDGKVRLTLGTHERGAYVSFFDSTGAEQIRLRLDDATGPSLRLSDGPSQTLIEPGPQ